MMFKGSKAMNEKKAEFETTTLIAKTMPLRLKHLELD